MRETQTLIPGDYATIARPLAEAVDPEMVKAAMRRHETRRSTAGLFYSAWNQVEYAVNSNLHKDITDTYFDNANALLAEVIQRPNAHQDARLGAFTLSSYIPVFSKRANEQPIDGDDCEDIYRSLGMALQYLRPLHIDEPPQWRMAEAAVLSLSARMRQSDLLLYPASPREEQSSNQRLNHDSYFFTGTDKLPVQQKLMPTQKIYDECITVLTLEPLIDKALKVTGGSREEKTTADKVNYLIALIVTEAATKKLTSQETKFLNFLTEAVAAHHSRLASVSRKGMTPVAA